MFKVRTVRVQDPGNLLAAIQNPGALAWVHRGDGLVGWGQAARIVMPACPDRFAVAESLLRGLLGAAQTEDHVGLPGCGPVAFGSFTFDAARGGSVLVIPRTVLGRRDGTAWATTITASGADGDTRAPSVSQAEGLPLRGGSLTVPQWERAVVAAVARIRAGQIGKVVLARDLLVTAPAPIDTRAILKVLAARDPDCYVFACAGLIGATPELLIAREGRQARARVIAGTAARGVPAEDPEISEALLASAKDSVEHRYAVESVSQVLAPLCDNLAADAMPSVIRLADMHHLATTIRGTLKVRATALALAGLLHPTAAVCGTPTAAAMDVIRELEGMDRGRYAAPIGWIDAHGDGEWGIALHCGEIDGTRARLFAGCGIVAASEPASELAEAEAKFRPMLHALGRSRIGCQASPEDSSS